MFTYNNRLLFIHKLVLQNLKYASTQTYEICGVIDFID